MKPDERRVVGLYVSPDGYRNQSFAYFQVVYSRTTRSGGEVIEHGRPFYAHDMHPALTPLFGIVCAVWKAVMPALTQRDEVEEKSTPATAAYMRRSEREE